MPDGGVPATAEMWHPTVACEVMVSVQAEAVASFQGCAVHCGQVAQWSSIWWQMWPFSVGSSLWLCQSSKDLCSISAQSVQCRPSTVQLPPDAEMRTYAACQDALWALDNLGQVFIRTLSKSCPTGMHWTKLDLTQLGTASMWVLPSCGKWVHVTYVSCWAYSSTGHLPG